MGRNTVDVPPSPVPEPPPPYIEVDLAVPDHPPPPPPTEPPFDARPQHYPNLPSAQGAVPGAVTYSCGGSPTGDPGHQGYPGYPAPPPQIIFVNAPPPPAPSAPVHTDTDKCIEIILILFLPFLAVWYHGRQCGGHVCLNICLCFFLYLPGICHAVWYCYIRDGNRK